MMEGMIIGAAAAAAWVTVLVALTSPWAQDAMQHPVPDVVEAIVSTAAGLTAYHFADELSDVHGRWVGYGSVFGAGAVTLGVLGLVVRWTPLFQAWEFHGIPIGRVPAPKSRRAPRLRRV